MKKLLTIILSLSLFACNSQTDSKGKASAVDARPASKPEDKGCSALLWFKKGTVLEYSQTDATGKSLGNSITTIEDVRVENGVTVADYSIQYANNKSVKATYRCEGDKIFMNMKSFFENSFSGLAKSGVTMEVSDAYVSFPSNMKVGDELEGATLVITSKKDGKDFMKMTSTYKERKVEAAEKVTVPAGSFDCLKLNEVRTIATSMMGREMPAREAKSIDWFNPKAGLVKFEMYDDTGKLTVRSELVSIK